MGAQEYSKQYIYITNQAVDAISCATYNLVVTIGVTPAMDSGEGHLRTMDTARAKRCHVQIFYMHSGSFSLFLLGAMYG